MNKFIFLSFIFMGWAFYEMSGGADFQPATRATAEVAEAAPATANSADEPVRIASLNTRTDAAPSDPGLDALPVVTRASFSNIEVTPRPLDESDLASVDPAVLDAFTGTPEPVALVTPAAADLRAVTGNRVNMRNGPGTSYPVIGRLTRGQEVEVISEPGNGWLQLRVSDTGNVGWMADFLVTSAD